MFGHYQSSTTGLRLVPVLCEKCGSGFFYELARVGTARATALSGPYDRGAAESSRQRAEEARERRLAEEAELVPCPRCGWINEDLIAKYRRGRYRGWGTFAGGLAALGTALSLLVGWFLWTSPAPDWSSTWGILIGGPAASMTLAGLLVVVRDRLRLGIRPNRSHPLPPTGLPRGSPPPLVRDPSTGTLEAAPPGPVQAGSVVARDESSSGRRRRAADGWVDFQVGRGRLPMACTTCLGIPDPRAADRRPLFGAVELVLPRCDACDRQQKRSVWKAGLLSLVATMAVVVPLLIAVIARRDEGNASRIAVVILVSFVPPIAVVIAQIRSKPARVRLVDRPRGIVRIRFRNERYRELIETQVR